jgi:hypothetical protein
MSLFVIQARKLQRLVGVDRAIYFTVLARGWSVTAGLMNLFLIAHFLSLSEQGYFYTFSSLVAIQIVFELGFSFVILQMAAHERARLKTVAGNRFDGDPVAHARLASIFQRAVKWYSRAAVIMCVVLLGAGIRFFSHNHDSASVHWLFPWCLDALAAAVTFQIDPIIAFLEGCGWVSHVARMRFLQAVAASLFGWSALLLHCGLYAPAMMLVGQATVGLFFILKTHGPLLLGLLKHDPGENSVSWKREIWPFQWRIAISWASAYFIFQIFNPVVFSFRGSAEAGRMGMSLSICSSLSAVGISWIATKAAPFGTLVATNQIDELNRLFRRTLIQSTAVIFFGEVFILVGLSLIGQFVPRFAARVLPLSTFCLLLITVLLNHIVTSQAYYLRAHKQEPFLRVWVWIALLSCVGVVIGCKYWGTLGVAIAYLCCGGILRLIAGTYVFFEKRRLWHSNQSPASSVSL